MHLKPSFMFLNSPSKTVLQRSTRVQGSSKVSDENNTGECEDRYIN